jgi:hypothetical protein
MELPEMKTPLPPFIADHGEFHWAHPAINPSTTLVYFLSVPMLA